MSKDVRLAIIGGRDFRNYDYMKRCIDQLSKHYNATSQMIHHYSDDIRPETDVIFVFGSNPEGRHGAGAAKIARIHFGAVYGRGEGLQGHSYAIPTKDLRVRTNSSLRSISPDRIIASIRRMYDCARQYPGFRFMVAYRNTFSRSLNGYTGFEMIDMFIAAGPIPDNVWFSEEWYLTGKFNN